MSEFKLNKGYNIRLTGNAEKTISDLELKGKYASKPTDFKFLKPKLVVELNQNVKAGDVLYHAKDTPEIKFTAPVSGTVVEINRGDRRILESVVVEANNQQQYVEFDKYDENSLEKANSEQIVNNLLESGLWPSLIKRPYGVMANPKQLPRDIFISCVDSAPLATDQTLLIGEESATFQFGLDVLKKLTNGLVYLGIDGSNNDSKRVFGSFKNVQINSFNGKHPAGNVGVQIHHIKPINRGDIVWTLRVSDVLEIGRLFKTGYLQSSIIVSVAGENAGSKQYYRTHRGVSIDRMINGLKDNSRIISGNVLTGKQIDSSGYLGFFDDLISIIPEGDHFEFLGWILPGFKKESFSGTYLTKFFPAKEYSHNTNLHGGHRNFVQTGYYEKVLPMDILPVHLLKSMITEDIELMEGLGVYEIIEEDLALCEYICPSKVQVQDIIRDGFELMIREV